MKHLYIVSICITIANAGSMLAMEENGHRWSMGCNGGDIRAETNRKISNLFNKCKDEHRQANVVRRDSTTTNSHDPIVLRCKQKDLQQRMCHWAIQDFSNMMDQNLSYAAVFHTILDNAAIPLTRTEPTFRREFREAFSKPLATN
jgi:hypothetical protein